jgi:CBS domain-containing protein
MEPRANIDGAAIRQRLGALTVGAIRVLGAIARRLGVPATAATLATVPVSAAMLTRLDTVTPGQSLEDAASLFVTGRQALLPLVQDGEPVGVMTRDDVATGLRLAGPRAMISQAPHHEAVSVTPSESLADVLEKLRAVPDSVAVVIDDGQAVGLLTFERVIEYLEKKRAA